MTLTDISIKGSYDTNEESPLIDFYIPALNNTVQYDRIAGFFSSSALAVAARGIGGLIANDGHMRLIASPRLSKEDAEVIANAEQDPQQYLGTILERELDTIESSFKKDHLQALGWMMANGLLSIKLAIISGNYETSDALFHQKVGIMTDKEGHSISFSGSLNETALGWLKNIEEFKVFKSWDEGQKSYFDSDKRKFEDYWNNRRSGVNVVDIPEAVSQKLIEIGKDFKKDSLCLSRYLEETSDDGAEKQGISLFWYQKEAHDKWIENEYRMLFEMATGTGKTRTAIACIDTLLKENKNLVVVIACPQTTLSKQWLGEINKLNLKFDESLIVDSTNTSWRSDLDKALKKIQVGLNKSLAIYTTHQTASSNDFIDLISNYRKAPLCFVGDEVHGLGARKTKRALLPIYRYRIGLSATPKRWFDDYGTEIIEEFFGNTSYVFSIADALSEINPATGKTFLVQYEYYPVPLSLTDDEIEKYRHLSNQINKLAKYAERNEEYREKLENLLFERAKIVKAAANKLEVLGELLDDPNSHLKKPVEDTLLFVADRQIDEVMNVLQNHRIISHKFTQEEGNKSDAIYGGLSERQYLINQFKKKTYKALVAIKCLDEGIDIPSASTAIIMSSSTNPREYIQRIGRVIRQDEGKTRAYIFDFIVVPDFRKLKDPELIAFEAMIFTKELKRIETIAKDAINNATILNKINEWYWEVNHAK